MPTSFAVNLKRLRLAAGLSQAELAESSGVPRGYIADLEQGRREPGWEVALKLAAALGVSLDEFRADVPAVTQKRGRPRKDA